MMEIIDLTKEISELLEIYPGDPKVEIQQWTTIEKSGYSVHKLCLGSHTGTHLDAPSHMIPNGKTLDEIDLQKLVGNIVKLKFTHKHIKLEDVVNKIREIKKESILILDVPKGGFLDVKVAQLIVENKKIKAVGFSDGANIDTPRDSSFPVHKIFLKAEVPIITGLVNLERVIDGDLLIVLPLKIQKLDGSPCRAIVLRNI